MNAPLAPPLFHQPNNACLQSTTTKKVLMTEVSQLWLQLFLIRILRFNYVSAAESCQDRKVERCVWSSELNASCLRQWDSAVFQSIFSNRAKTIIFRLRKYLWNLSVLRDVLYCLSRVVFKTKRRLSLSSLRKTCLTSAANFLCFDEDFCCWRRQRSNFQLLTAVSSSGSFFFLKLCLKEKWDICRRAQDTEANRHTPRAKLLPIHLQCTLPLFRALPLPKSGVKGFTWRRDGEENFPFAITSMWHSEVFRSHMVFDVLI